MKAKRFPFRGWVINRRNWLSLTRKLVDVTDWDYSINSVLTYLQQLTLSFFGEGVLTTTTYPSPFPITMSSSALSGTVGSGIAYDPQGTQVRIDAATTSTSMAFTVTANASAFTRYDLLVLQYAATGDTQIPEPSNPLANIYLNIHDDFVLKVIPGTASSSPSYPSKGSLDIILAGLQVPAGALIGTAVAVDLTVRDIAQPYQVVAPTFKQEAPAGLVNGTNTAFTLSATPNGSAGVIVILDGQVLPSSAWSLSDTTLTLANAPAVGQSVYAWYIINSSSSTNPLAVAQETPAGTANGSNATFSLTGKPSTQDSTTVYVDGAIVPEVGWSLQSGGSGSKIIFNSDYIPAAGQDVYCVYLINALTNGSSSSSSSGGSSAPTLFGSVSSPSAFDPTAGLTTGTGYDQIYFLQPVSGSGAISVSASSQISSGTAIGQRITLRGTSSSDYYIFQGNAGTIVNGLSMNGNCSLTNNQSIRLMWDGVAWFEETRRN